MGADFIEKAAPSFKKSWDRGRLKLSTPDLFTQQVNHAARSFAADLHSGVKLKKGETITVEKEGQSLVVMRGLHRVGQSNQPPIELLKAIEASCGIAKGTVEDTHDAAGVAEISLC